MKKILSMVVAMLLGATSLMAQAPAKGLSYAGAIGVGTELELGGRAQYNFNQYFAVDVLSLKYAYDWRDKSANNEITIQAGVRGFSPSFGPDLKAFAALDLGYGADFQDGYNVNCFALDFTMGLYVWKGMYVGYGFGGLFNNGHAPHDHVVRVGYNFTF